LLDEEACAGWVLVEKFDDRRVRFKRRRSAAPAASSLPAGYNPYRTQYGISQAVVTLVVLALVFGAFFACLVFAFLSDTVAGR
jgi:hypothetical protein